MLAPCAGYRWFAGVPGSPAPAASAAPPSPLSSRAGRTPAAALGLLEQFIERLSRAADLGRSRDDRSPTSRMFALAIQHHPTRAITHLRRKLVRRLACHRSTF